MLAILTGSRANLSRWPAAWRRRLGLPRSTTYRLFDALAGAGLWPPCRERRQYGLGVAVYGLGSAYQRQAPLQRMARPILHRLVDGMRQNAGLAVLPGGICCYLIEDRAPGRALLITRRRRPVAGGTEYHRQPAWRFSPGFLSGGLTLLYPPLPMHSIKHDEPAPGHGRGAAPPPLTRMSAPPRFMPEEEDLVTISVSGALAQGVVDHVGRPVRQRCSGLGGG